MADQRWQARPDADVRALVCRPSTACALIAEVKCGHPCHSTTIAVHYRSHEAAAAAGLCAPLARLDRSHGGHDHTEVVSFVVAAPDGGVALCVERNEELTVAESYASLGRAGASCCTWRDWPAARGERLTPSRPRRPRRCPRVFRTRPGCATVAFRHLGCRKGAQSEHARGPSVSGGPHTATRLRPDGSGLALSAYTTLHDAKAPMSRRRAPASRGTIRHGHARLQGTSGDRRNQ